MPPFDVVIRGASEVLTVTGTPGEPAERALAPISRGAIGIVEEKIAWLGPEAELPADAVGPATEVIEAGGGFVGPGFVDPHTHLVFAGERATEFDRRAQGKSYLELAQEGGGIMATVRATRAASEDQLVALAGPRLRRLLDQGVTTAEVKSGYGLTVADELKMLRAVRRLGAEQPIELVPTLMCAHTVPEEHKAERARYVALCANEIVPAVAEAGLAVACDAFVDEGAFTHDEARKILGAAHERGMKLRLHVDQLTGNGGAQLAAELGAASADHLEHVTPEGIAALAKAGVSAVLVPTSTLFLRVKPYAPGRKLREAGLNVALCTNVNPGSAMTENVSLAMGLACLENGLTAAEAYWAFTRGAALALGLPNHGRLAVGGPADAVVFGCTSFLHLPYHLGVNHARAVVKHGLLVASPRGLGAPLCA
ncbi:MAG: imidazolonepropionase [Myxococcaceae bacterium]